MSYAAKLLAALSLPLLASGCGGGGGGSWAPAPYPPPPEPSPTAAPTVAVPEPSTAPTTATPAASVPTPPARVGAYALAWRKPSTSWNHAIAIAPWGDVIAAAMHELVVMARDTGQILARTATCDMLRADSLAFIDQTMAVLACEDEIRQLVFPLSSTSQRAVPALKLPWEAECGAVRAGLVAVGSKDGKVIVVRARKLEQIDSFDVGGELESLAISPDGQLVAAGLRGGDIKLRSLKTRQNRLLHKAGTGVNSMQFSPDGKELFAEVSSFTGGAIDVQGGALGRSYRLSSWITTLRYVGPRTVVAAGAQGVSLLRPEGRIDELQDETGEGADVSPDGSLICGGDRRGNISCFASRPLEPSRYSAMAGWAPDATTPPAATSAPTATPGSTPPPAAAAATELEGKLASRVGKKLVVTVPSAQGVSLGAKGELSRRFGQSLGSMSISGWLVVASVTVTKVEPTRIELRLDAEQSTITVNSQKVDHFAPGTEVKLALGK